MTKRKDERRELLKEDELLSGMERVADYIQKNPKQVLVWTTGIFLVLAVFFGSITVMKSNKKKAAGSLYKAEKILATDISDENAEFKFATEKEKYEAALKEVDAFLENHGGLAEQQATLLKINCLTSLGRQDDILSLYETLAGSGGGMKMFGVKGLADYHFVKKNYDEAIGYYQQLQKMDNVSEALASYRIAACHKEKGETEKAREMLDALVEKYKDVEAANRPQIHFKAEQMLTELKDKEVNGEG